jgi:threonine dehydrogenase-like Zn-dependent dehydrogenase
MLSWLEDVAVPEIGINDVLIRVLNTGIRGTDVHITGTTGRRKPTRVSTSTSPSSSTHSAMPYTPRFPSPFLGEDVLVTG